MNTHTSEIHDADGIAKLGLVELNYEIARCEARMKIAPNSLAKRAFAERLKWLKAFRNKQHYVVKD